MSRNFGEFQIEIAHNSPGEFNHQELYEYLFEYAKKDESIYSAHASDLIDFCMADKKMDIKTKRKKYQEFFNYFQQFRSTHPNTEIEEIDYLEFIQEHPDVQMR